MMLIKDFLELGPDVTNGRLLELFGSAFVVDVGLPDDTGAGPVWIVPLAAYLVGDHDDRQTPETMPLERGIVLPWRLEYLGVTDGIF